MANDHDGPYRSTWKIVARYWHAYGGWRAQVRSPFLHIALLVAVLLHHHWLTERWWDVALGALPNLLGFSLGGYAMWISFGDERFRELMCARDDPAEVSAYLDSSATFVHFIVVQIVALLGTLICRGLAYDLSPEDMLYRALNAVGFSPSLIPEYFSPVGQGLAFVLFAYSVTSALAASLAVYRLTILYDELQRVLARERELKRDKEAQATCQQ